MKKYYTLFLLSILMNIGVVSAQNVSLQSVGVNNSLSKFDFSNGENVGLAYAYNSDIVSEIGMFLSKDLILDKTDIQIGYNKLPAQNASVVVSYTFPPYPNYLGFNDLKGKFYVIFYVDFNKKIAETNENDNILSYEINMTPTNLVGYEISNLNTNNLQYYNLNQYNGISGSFNLKNNSKQSLYLQSTNKFEFFLSTKTYIDETAIRLDGGQYSKPTLSVVPSLGTTNVDFTNLYPYGQIFDGYYYLLLKYSNDFFDPNPYSNVLETSDVNYQRLKIGMFFSGNINNDFNINLPQDLTLNSPYSVNLSEYLKGREYNYGSTPTCFTSKSNQNTVDFFVRFKATASTMSLTLSADDVSLESAVELTTSPKTCINNVQSGSNLRYYTFDNLTVGNFYTARVEYGGNSPIGYARTDASTATSVTLSEGGITTGIESNTNNNVVSIYPNPSNDGKFSISSTQLISKIKVSNALGESEIFNNTNEFKTTLKGLLFVEVTDENGNSSVSKVVVE